MYWRIVSVGKLTSCLTVALSSWWLAFTISGQTLAQQAGGTVNRYSRQQVVQTQSSSAPQGRPVATRSDQQQRQAQSQMGQNAQQQLGTPGQEEQIRVPLMNVDQAAQQGFAQVRQQPFPELNAESQKYLNDVLDVWEQRTAVVKRYECDFSRYQYDPTKYGKSFFSQANGRIKFMAPDKGMLVVDNLETIAQKEPEPVYKVDPRRPHGEYWICDGQWVYIRDRNEKKQTEIELPPQMRGAGIPYSPLPFLFGVKAEVVKSRYWIRPIQPPPGDDSVWLEAWPKRTDDAGNYSRVQVVLDRSDILPRALIVFLPNWRAGQEYKEIYEFTNRNVIKDNLLTAIKQNLFRQEFIPTKLPSDWQIFKEPYVPPEQQQPQPEGQAVGEQQRVAQPSAAANPQFNVQR